MRESQYIDQYLDANTNRGWGNGLTIGAFLQYRLRGKAVEHSTGYYTALQRAINRRLKTGTVVIGLSTAGREAYYRVEDRPIPQPVQRRLIP